MSASTFNLPIIGPRNQKSTITQNAEPSNTPAAELTRLEVRLVQNHDIVTDPIFLPAAKCRSIQSLLQTFDNKLMRVNNRAWHEMHGLYAEDAQPWVLWVQKTAGKGSDPFVTINPINTGSYLAWFNRNITSGQNVNSSVKIEIHGTQDRVAAGMTEYLGRIEDPTEEELEQERFEEEEEAKIPIPRRPLRRLEFIFEESDLLAKKIDEQGMRLPPMTARARRDRYKPKGMEFAPASIPWFKGETDTEANHGAVVEEDDEDDEDDDYDEEDVGAWYEGYFNENAVEEEEEEEEDENEDEEERDVKEKDEEDKDVDMEEVVENEDVEEDGDAMDIDG
ncbi:hypothetical protein AYL99_01947 [Fonsecaea erecta]|uniref:Uncharacterized protein n=1 Tax=Fonsecaea erecta TaxID=1367422 RepID=A0A178ZSC0_9EURO|nr:hypothetical protein AYL99_01947 [Fonsecaea erecta]OAP62720.1 hypothetical protein AYL99_01947 [Fonsecaea erecta]